MALGSQLDNNLIFEILSWLPVIALVRFSSVCKSWYSIIHDPVFMNDHFAKQSRRTDGRHVLFLPNDQDSSVDYCTLYDGNTRCDPLALPFEPMSYHFLRVIGSCNGLICFADQFPNYAFRLFIWNTSLRTLKLLPPSPSHRASSIDHSFFGIGFHVPSNDYRVVRLTYFYDYHGYRISLLTRTEVEVYSLSTDSWRMLNLDHKVRETRAGSVSVSVNGYIYWLASGRRVLSFNTANESFEEITHPTCSGFYLCSYHTAVVRERLCVMISPYTFNFDNKRKVHEIWMLKEHGVYESWTMLRRIEQSDKGISGTIGLTPKGEILQLTGVKGGDLSLYDHENSRYHELCEGDIVFVASYMESLALLNTQPRRFISNEEAVAQTLDNAVRDMESLALVNTQPRRSFSSEEAVAQPSGQEGEGHITDM